MSYVIGLCGTHGTGKSTILNGIKGLGLAVSESQIAREAQKALGWDALSRAQESVENVWALQNAILDAMIARDQAICDSQKLTLVERTPADALAYTLMWCQRLNINPEEDERALDYDQRCWEASLNYGNFIYIPMNDAIPFVPDPHRADLPSREFVAKTIRHFLEENLLPYYYLTATSREARVAEVKDVMNENG
jgi:AAA domain